MNDKIYKKRIKNLLKKVTCPIAIIGSNGNLRYFTGIGGLSGILLISKKENYLITADDELSKKSFIKNIINPKRRSLKELFRILNKKRIKRIGIDFSSLSINQYKRFKLGGFAPINIEEKIKKLREIKDGKEIENIKKACKLADKAMYVARETIEEGKTEREIRTKAVASVLDKCECVGFNFIVASGKNSLFIHPYPSNKKIKKGELIIIDLGLSVNGYKSDITRTFCLNPTKEQKELYKTVLEAQKIAIGSLKEGVYCKEISKKVELFFRNNGLGKYFKYLLGHGLGLDIWESPSFNKNSKDILKKNIVFTIEPGLHVPLIGGVRIEDTLVLRKNKVTSLTKFPKVLPL